MWNSLFPAAEPDPKLVSLELKNPQKLGTLITVLSDLYQQEKKLLAETKDDAGDVFYVKCKTFEVLMERIRIAIKEFNQHERENCNPALILMFVTKLKKIVQHVLELNRDELNRQKNENKQMMSRGIRRAAIVGSLVVGYVTFSPLLFLGTYAVSGRVSDAVQDAVSLDRENVSKTRSIILLDGLVEVLANIQRAMEYEISGEQKVEEGSFLECPINKTKFKDPVLCTLDGRLYEKTAILEALNKYRKSPFNNKELEPDQSPESALVSCYSIREAVEELEAKYKLAAAANDMHVEPPQSAAPQAPPPPSP